MMKRRHFLKTSLAAAIAAPTLIPENVLGKKTVPPSDRITIGCVGLGGQGTYNMRAFINQPDTRVVALCDVDEGVGNYDMLYQFPGSNRAGLEPAVERAIQWYGNRGIDIQKKDLATYTDFFELLERDDIDAVSVCTPDHWHGLVTMHALAAGKDVYCEKPLVNTIPEGRAVCDDVARYGRVLQTGSHERSNDSVRFACELVRNGRIGTLKEIHINMPNSDDHHERLRKNTQPVPPMSVPGGFDYNRWQGPAPYAAYTRKRTHFWWRYILDYGGGEMTDRGAHIIDLAQFINDMDNSGPVEIRATGEQIGQAHGLYDCFIEYDFECTYSNGVKMIGSSEGDRGLKLVGTDGWIFIHIHGGRLEARPKSLLKEEIDADEIHVGRSPGHHRNFLDCMRTRSKPVAHEEIGHRTATICHLLNIGMLLDRPLQWDPVNERVTNDEAADKVARKPMRSPWRIQ